MTPCRFFYVTCESRAQAQQIGRILVDERLAACVNITGEIDSIYRWQGKIEQARETVMIVKTTRSLGARVIARIKALHPYECPCIVAFDVADGHADYLRWIDRETARGDPSTGT